MSELMRCLVEEECVKRDVVFYVLFCGGLCFGDDGCLRYVKHQQWGCLFLFIGVCDLSERELSSSAQ